LRKGELRGISTGFPVIDQCIGGLSNQEVTVIGSTRRWGKTSFLLDILIEVCVKQNIPSVLLSVKENRQEIMARLLSKLAGKSHKSIFSVWNGDGRAKFISDAATKLGEANLYIDDSPGYSDYFEDVIRSYKSEKKIGCIFIDGLFETPLSKEWSGERAYDRVKEIARQNDLPVVCTVPLCTAKPGPPRKRPQFDDMPYPYAARNDADNILLLHRIDFEYGKYGWGANQAIVAHSKWGHRAVPLISFDDEKNRYIDESVTYEPPIVLDRTSEPVNADCAYIHQTERRIVRARLVRLRGKAVEVETTGGMIGDPYTISQLKIEDASGLVEVDFCFCEMAKESVPAIVVGDFIEVTGKVGECHCGGQTTRYIKPIKLSLISDVETGSGDEQ
jgi:hypothetical protein